MSLATLDTHEVVKDLQSAGFTDAQAEGGARNIRKAQDLDLSSLATKPDVEKVRADLTGEIQKVRSDLTSEIEKIRTAIADSKADTIKWVLGAIGFQTLIILGGVIGLMKSLKP